MPWKNEHWCSSLYSKLQGFMSQFYQARKQYDELCAKQRPFRVPYAGRVFDEKERLALLEAVCDFWGTDGEISNRFETAFAKFVGSKHAIFVNSGSSANLLAVAALMNWANDPDKTEYPVLKPGDKVITPALCFPTTVSPLVQFGLIPIFCDVTQEENYNITVKNLEEAFKRHPDAKVVIAAHVLGSPFEASKVQDWCKKNNLWMIADCCDALGAKDGITWNISHFSDIATFSFYPAHHLFTFEGGMVCTDDPDIAKVLRSLRDWGRDCMCPTGKDNCCGSRFDQQFEGIPEGYDHKYIYSTFGFNLKATEFQAAVGCTQLEKLPGFIETRNENWDWWKMTLSQIKGFNENIDMPDDSQFTTVLGKLREPSWFGFVMTLKPDAKFSRSSLVRYLESQNIQTRMIFAGNIMRQPLMKTMPGIAAINNVSFPVCDIAMDRAFWIGVYPGYEKEHFVHVEKHFKIFLKQFD